MCIRRTLRVALLVTALGGATASIAEGIAFEGRRAVAAEVLGQMRGGFTTQVDGARLELSFGVDRVVSVNGEIVASTSFRVPSVQELAFARSGFLLQTGPGNEVAVGAAAGSALHVIQNSLDNQVLRQVTTINASVRNLDMFRAAQFGAMLNRQLIMSVR